MFHLSDRFSWKCIFRGFLFRSTGCFAIRNISRTARNRLTAATNRMDAMAEKRTRTFTKTNSATGSRQHGNNSKTGSKNTNVDKSSSDLLSREEEYKRLNAELEAKTAHLVEEAESVIKHQESFISKSSLLDNINSDEFLDNLYDEEDESSRRSKREPEHDSARSQMSNAATSARAASSSASHLKSNNHTRSQSGKSHKTQTSASNKVRPKGSKSNLSDDVAVPNDTFLTEYKDFSLQKTISNAEGRLGSDDFDDDDDDIMPSAAAEMAAEAQIRFLKAKLRVMQEELDRLGHECGQKEEESGSQAARLKLLEEEKTRLQRTNTSQQQQIDKHKRVAEDAKGKAESLENQLVALKKEVEGLKRSQKQQASTQGTTEVRLNRALEELERCKAQLSRAKSSSKDSSDQDKRKMEQLMAENKRLEKQKNELMTGFKKQLKLIDILKRQKMHIEAAKMLSFTEEEFVKALEWGN